MWNVGGYVFPGKYPPAWFKIGASRFENEFWRYYLDPRRAHDLFEAREGATFPPVHRQR